VWVEARVVRWISSGGFGFVSAAGVEAFVHCSVVSGNMDDLVNARLMVRLEQDAPRGVDKFRVSRARRLEEHEAELARERAIASARDAVEAAQRAKRAVEVADDAAQRSAWSTVRLLKKPPGLVGEELGGAGGGNVKGNKGRTKSSMFGDSGCFAKGSLFDASTVSPFGAEDKARRVTEAALAMTKKNGGLFGQGAGGSSLFGGMAAQGAGSGSLSGQLFGGAAAQGTGRSSLFGGEDKYDEG
jgi:cold shock CspA family protein